MELLAIKYLHMVSATILFGTGLGSVFYKWRADRSGDIHAIAVTNRNVVLADWIFTTPTVLLQPVSGLFLVYLNAYDWHTPWLLISIVLFIVAGLCWLPVVFLQIKMRNISTRCAAQSEPLPPQYHHIYRIWCLLGIPAFIAMLAIFGLMVTKPDF